MVQVIYIKKSGKTLSPLGNRYFPALIAQRLARSLRKSPGFESHCGQESSFCNSRFALLTDHVHPCK